MEINKIFLGDSLEVLKTFPDESVDCAITSPPYWELRDYGVSGQLGLETTFQEYITKLCNIFDEVKRVLKKTGTCWVNLGDTYLDKSLCQVPSHFAIEMCKRGWLLRNRIIWHKPNCMPSGVDDRFTVDFEDVFFFTKSQSYHFEQQFDQRKTFEERKDAIVRDREENYNSKASKLRGTGMARHGAKGSTLNNPEKWDPLGKNKRCVWSIPTKGNSEAHFATYPEALIAPMIKAGCPEKGIVLDIFMGSGTTAVTARKLGRNYLGIDLNPEYIKIAEKRLIQQVLL